MPTIREHLCSRWDRALSGSTPQIAQAGDQGANPLLIPWEIRSENYGLTPALQPLTALLLFSRCGMERNGLTACRIHTPTPLFPTRNQTLACIPTEPFGGTPELASCMCSIMTVLAASGHKSRATRFPDRTNDLGPFLAIDNDTSSSVLLPQFQP